LRFSEFSMSREMRDNVPAQEMFLGPDMRAL